MDGIINLDKPGGISSARAVAQVKRLLPKGTKIGHAGTLDPFATGVLLLLIGKATKACERLMGEPKTYETTMKLGARTATDDLESPEVPYVRVAQPPSAVIPTLDDIKRILPRFIGAIQQRPPAYSAMKVGGRRAYYLARRGKPVELEPRTVHVHSIELLDYTWPFLKLRIDCGRGTYIRSIARDLGEALDVGAYLTELRRTRIGRVEIAESVTLQQLVETGVAPHVRRIPAQI